MAAVLASGAEAVLSHRSAAALWGIGSDNGHIETVIPGKARPRGQIRRRHAQLAPDEVTMRRRIPVTTLTRTLLDIAADLSVEGFEAALREAEYLHRFRLEELEKLLERHPGKRGTGTVRTGLRRLHRGPRGRARSRLEARFAALISRSDLPRPRLNALLDLGGFKIQADCLWLDQQ